MTGPVCSCWMAVLTIGGVSIGWVIGHSKSDCWDQLVQTHQWIARKDGLPLPTRMQVMRQLRKSVKIVRAEATPTGE